VQREGQLPDVLLAILAGDQLSGEGVSERWWLLVSAPLKEETVSVLVAGCGINRSYRFVPLDHDVDSGCGADDGKVQPAIREVLLEGPSGISDHHWHIIAPRADGARECRGQRSQAMATAASQA